MIIFKELTRLRTYLEEQKSLGKSLGFFPTMGALHQGHLALLHAAQKDADLTISSIFVNPTQFNNPDDLKKYPRTLPDDLKQLELAGCDIVVVPDADELYSYETVKDFDLDGIDIRIEGASRPGHFQGVARVVKIFFDIIHPDHAYFGQKDFQQCMVIQKMSREYHPDLQLHFVPTIREESGLAMSSRNKRLNADETDRAKVIYQALDYARNNIGQQSISTICEEARKMIQTPEDMTLDYFEIVEPETLETPTQEKEAAELVAVAAAFIGDVRLIDNLYVKRAV